MSLLRNIAQQTRQWASAATKIRFNHHQPRTNALSVLSTNKCHGGHFVRLQHESDTTKTHMNFSVYVPEKRREGETFPVLYWLSGLTCDETNFITKAGSAPFLAKERLMVVCCDTSPRGLDLPGEHDAYDFGSGAGFYLNATTPGYRHHYHMHDYVTQELPALVEANFPATPERRSIFGHSMGGLGALNLYLKNPGRYQSVSAFSPICNPLGCAWGQKAFKGYLEDSAEWPNWDPSVLLSKADPNTLNPILVHQGTDDEFLEQQLHPHTIADHPSVHVEMCQGYDHSYYFISTYIGEHIAHHAKFLKN